MCRFVPAKAGRPLAMCQLVAVRLNRLLRSCLVASGIVGFAVWAPGCLNPWPDDYPSGSRHVLDEGDNGSASAGTGGASGGPTRGVPPEEGAAGASGGSAGSGMNFGGSGAAGPDAGADAGSPSADAGLGSGSEEADSP